MHCIKLGESQSHHFLFIISRFSFVSNATIFFIHSLNMFALEKKLAGEENPFGFYVESIAFRMKILRNFHLIIKDSSQIDSNMRKGTYLDQTQAII